MKIDLTGKEAKQAVLSLTRLEANRSYNALHNLLAALEITGNLSNEAMDTIEDSKVYSIDLDKGGEGWQGVLDALGESPAREVFNLLTKLLQVTQSS